MNESESLIHAHRFDGKGWSRPLGFEDIQEALPPGGFDWIHLNRASPESRRWLLEEAGLDTLVVDSLFAGETRPRCAVFEDGILLNLRGVNLNPGADPEDMISLRMWVTSSRVITIRYFKVMAVQDIRERIERGNGPASVGGLITLIANRMVDRMEPVILDLDDKVDEIEDQSVTDSTYDMRTRLGVFRRMAIKLRRYIGAQREALAHLYSGEIEWLDQSHRESLHNISDRVTRIVEELDAIRDRAAIVQEEISNHLAEKLNRNIYILSIVATIFLPLGLIAGLLGINVEGIPGAKSPWAFSVVCASIVVLAGIELWLIRKLKLF